MQHPLPAPNAMNTGPLGPCGRSCKRSICIFSPNSLVLFLHFPLFVLKMKLLTHNLLTSQCLKGVMVGYPLKICATETKQIEVDYNAEFVQRVIPKMEWSVLKEAASNLGLEVPNDPPSASDETALRKVHHALFEVEIVQGELICPETGRKFPIKQGIPNMLCNEDEVK